MFQIAENEMEVGIAIHGAQGRRRTTQVTATELVSMLIEAVVADPPCRSRDRVALMINGLGGTPISELYLLYGIAREQLSAENIGFRGPMQVSIALLWKWLAPP